MIEFATQWVLFILPLPLLIHYLIPAAKPRQEAALRVPFIDDFSGIGQQGVSRKPRSWPLLLALLAWICLVVAAARPEWVGDPIELPTSGRDLMLAVDLSGSMEERDFELSGRTVDRLTATKAIAGEFVRKRVGDRVGLILFGEQAYLQTPLTFDRETVRTLLYEAAIGLAGQATAIGDAIGLMVKRLQDKDKVKEVMILLTDGANTAGEVTPIKAAELAADKGLKIYTIGIGADRMTVQTLFGAREVNPSKDLDEKTLKAIAEKTGGRYFRAKNTEELSKIYALIDQLEPIEQDAQVFRPKQALFFYPLGAAMALATLLIVALSWRSRRG